MRLSTPYEYHYLDDNVPVLVPDEPGEYVIRIRANLIWEDDVTGELGATSEALAFLVVEGPSLGSGCSVGGTPTAGYLGLVMLLGLLAIRRMF